MDDWSAILLHNARIYTLDSQREVASAVLIQGDRVRAIGNEELLEVPAERLDLGGATVLPGLTDAHIHLQQYALALQKLDCQTATVEECVQRVARRAAETRPGEWIVGHGWDQNLWNLPQGGWPHRSFLDAVAPHHPVYLTARSLHAAWVNSVALARAGITASTPSPPNGEIQRDLHGQPTGILLEAAMNLVADCIPAPGLAEVTAAIRAAQPVLCQMGLTGVHDFDRRLCFLALQELHQQGELQLRVIKNIPVEDLEHAWAIGLRSGFGDDWLRIGSVKVFMDGALGPRTAAMFQPYEGEPENRGLLNMDGETLFEIACRAAEVGLSMAVHAIGDRANHEVLNAYAQLRRYEQEHGLPPRRHRIEHVQVLHPDDVPRLAQSGVIASMQPIHATSDMLMADRYWGDRVRWAYAWRSQWEHGATLAFGSDAPVESPNPFLGLFAAVTRRRPDGTGGPQGWVPQEKLTLRQALEAYTVGPAYAAGLESRLGRLAPGYLADLIVLENDPFESPPEEWLSMQPLATMVGGRWVWRSL